MEQSTYKVYARLDGAGSIAAINSSAFLNEPDGWVQIDEGVGDRYHHAQGNYLAGGLYTRDGIPLYCWDGAQVVQRAEEEIEGDRVPDVSAIRASKLAEISAAGNAAIVAGVDVTLPSTGEEGHFALHETDQINLTAALTAVEQGAAGYPYHADGQLCRLYPAADILAISQAAIRHKLYHTTYCNHLLVWARRAETAEELEGITYGAELPEDLADNLASVLAAAGGGVNG